MQVIDWLDVKRAMFTRNLLLVRGELQKGFRHCCSYVISGLGEGASRQQNHETGRKPNSLIFRHSILARRKERFQLAREKLEKHNEDDKIWNLPHNCRSVFIYHSCSSKEVGKVSHKICCLLIFYLYFSINCFYEQKPGFKI